MQDGSKGDKLRKASGKAGQHPSIQEGRQASMDA